MDLIKQAKQLLLQSIEFRKLALKKISQTITRTDPIMDYVDKFKDQLLQSLANISAGKTLRSVDVYLNFDGTSASFLVEAMGPDAESYQVEAAKMLNVKFKQILSVVSRLFKKEGSNPVKQRVLADVTFS